MYQILGPSYKKWSDESNYHSHIKRIIYYTTVNKPISLIKGIAWVSLVVIHPWWDCLSMVET